MCGQGVEAVLCIAIVSVGIHVLVAKQCMYARRQLTGHDQSIQSMGHAGRGPGQMSVRQRDSRVRILSAAVEAVELFAVESVGQEVTISQDRYLRQRALHVRNPNKVSSKDNFEPIKVITSPFLSIKA
eukprot:GHUV01039204.1.p2 GENE.GHUV01039204.1~~GHUV01039204.1.p2  ORF type:complete len:128 (+),score=4.20 GHUV01039204.1:482-865(+)